MEIENIGLNLYTCIVSMNGRVGGIRFEQPICLWLADSGCTLARGAVGMHVTGSHIYDCVIQGKAAVSVFPR